MREFDVIIIGAGQVGPVGRLTGRLTAWAFNQLLRTVGGEDGAVAIITA